MGRSSARVIYPLTVMSHFSPFSDIRYVLLPLIRFSRWARSGVPLCLQWPPRAIWARECWCGASWICPVRESLGVLRSMRSWESSIGICTPPPSLTAILGRGSTSATLNTWPRDLPEVLRGRAACRHLPKLPPASLGQPLELQFEARGMVMGT